MRGQTLICGDLIFRCVLDIVFPWHFEHLTKRRDKIIKKYRKQFRILKLELNNKGTEIFCYFLNVRAL